jgi:hypothetical protein
MRELIEAHGAPGYIRSDNGPEFIAKSLQSRVAAEVAGAGWHQNFVH